MTLPTFSFQNSRGGTATPEQLIARSVWAVAPIGAATDKPAIGSAAAVSDKVLLASCDVGLAGGVVGIARRSAERDARIEAHQGSAKVCELHPGDVPLSAVLGYRAYDSVQVGEPVLAAISRTSRSFILLRGTVSAKGSSDDPYLETDLVLPAGTQSAAVFDESGRLIGFGSATGFADSYAIIMPVDLGPTTGRSAAVVAGDT